MSEDGDEKFNAANPAQVRDRGRKQKHEEEQELVDLRELLKLPAAQRFLWRQLEKCHVWASSFHPSGQVFAANEGRRGVGVELMTQIIEADPQAWIDLQQQRLDAERKRAV